MKNSIKVIFGKEQVNKIFDGIPLTADELESNMKEYYFKTKEELLAFQTGLNEAIGWTELYIYEL